MWIFVVDNIDAVFGVNTGDFLVFYSAKVLDTVVFRCYCWNLLQSMYLMGMNL